MKLFIKLIPLTLSWAVFIGVILFMPYPETLSQASFFQLTAFFIPLFLGIAFAIDFVFNNIASSIAFSLGIILLICLKALKAVNSLWVLLIIIAVTLLISYFKGSKSSRLTSNSFVPKLKNLRRKK